VSELFYPYIRTLAHRFPRQLDGEDKTPSSELLHIIHDSILIDVANPCADVLATVADTMKALTIPEGAIHVEADLHTTEHHEAIPADQEGTPQDG
jgi:hypothetical protein